jgi:putative hydrolase of the HAD superfamily
MKIKHVFFDLDHTLWDFEKNSGLTFRQIFKEENILLSFEAFISIYKPINLRYWKLYREEKVSKEELRYLRLKETFDALEYAISDILIDKIAINYIAFLPNHNHLFEGTFELLTYLKDKYHLHIITNGFEEVQALKMEKSGLMPYFNKIVTSESVGVKKPNPKVFEFALQISEAEIDNSIMIGDNLEADIQGALDFGIKAIHCNFDQLLVANKEIISVKSLAEIKLYL